MKNTKKEASFHLLLLLVCYQNGVVLVIQNDVVLISEGFCFIGRERQVVRPLRKRHVVFCISEPHAHERRLSHADDPPFKRHVVSPIHRTTRRLNDANDSASKAKRRVARPSSPDDRSFNPFSQIFIFSFKSIFHLQKHFQIISKLH